MDLFSHEYGWTTENVLDMTLKELSGRMEAINQRQEQNNKFQAQLHGMSLKKTKSGITEEARRTFDKLLKGK